MSSPRKVGTKKAPEGFRGPVAGLVLVGCGGLEVLDTEAGIASANDAQLIRAFDVDRVV